MLRNIETKHLKLIAMISAMLIIVVFFSVATDGAFISPRNISNLIRQTAIVGILAIGMVFVIISAEIDLSVGSMMGLLGGIAAILDVWFNLHIAFTILLTLSAGLVLGLVNGWWVAYQKVPSFIVTLAGMLAFRGMLVGITNGVTIAPTSSSISILGQSYLPTSFGISIIGLVCLGIVAKVITRRKARVRYELTIQKAQFEYGKAAIAIFGLVSLLVILEDYRGIPTPILIMGTLILVASYIAQKTGFGRRIYAIGGNIEASRMSGLNVERIKMAVFGFNGVMVAVAALILTSRLGAGSPAAGNNAELDAIAACVIGGASLAGGRGTVFGAIMGALIMASLDNGMSILNIQTFWQLIVKGLILLLAVWLDVKTKKTY